MKPEAIVSPTTLLQWRRGDAWDMSILLCSLLLGAGYDAYCVCGCARMHITTNDRSAESVSAVPSLDPPVTEKEAPLANKYLEVVHST